MFAIVQPNLSASWLFQRAMSTRPQTNISPTFINELLFANFQSMQVNYFTRYNLVSDHLFYLIKILFCTMPETWGFSTSAISPGWYLGHCES